MTLLNLESLPVPGELRYEPTGAVTERESDDWSGEVPFRLQPYPEDGHLDRVTFSALTSNMAVEIVEPQGTHSFALGAASRGREVSPHEMVFESGQVHLRRDTTGHTGMC